MVTIMRREPRFVEIPVEGVIAGKGPPTEINIDSVFTEAIQKDGGTAPYYLKVGHYLRILRKREDKSGLKTLTTFQYVHFCNLVGLILEQYDTNYNQTSFFTACQSIASKDSE